MSTTKLYRSRNGLILGVCRGLADYLDISVKWTRILTVLTMIFTGFFPVAFFYVLAALFMKTEPEVFCPDACETHYDDTLGDLDRLRAKFNHLAARVNRATDKIFDPVNQRQKSTK